MLYIQDGISAFLVFPCLIAILSLVFQAVSTLISRASIASSLSASIVVIWCLLSPSVFVLGTLGMLSATTLYPMLIFLAFLLRFISRRRFGPCKAACPIKDCSDGAPLNRRVLQLSSYWVETAVLNSVAYIAGGLYATHLVTYGLLTLPHDWNSLSVHMPIVDHWIQYGHVWSQDCALWHVPSNSELFAYLLVSPFSGDFWINLNNVPALVLLISSYLELARHFRVNKWWRLITLLYACITQPFLRGVISLQNDISVASLALASLLFLVRYLRSSKNVDLILYAATTGLLAGVACYALGYVTVLVLVPLAWLLVRNELRRAMVIVGSATIGFMLFSSFWYWRNFILTGTPFPQKDFMEMLAWWDFPYLHLYDNTVISNGSDWRILRSLCVAWCVQAGVTAGGLVCASPLIVLGLWRRSLRQGDTRLLSLILLSTLIVYCVTPDVIEAKNIALNMSMREYSPVRFGLVPMMLCLLSAGLLATDWERYLNKVSYPQFRERYSPYVAAFSVIAAKLLSLGYLLVQATLHFGPFLGVEAWLPTTRILRGWSPRFPTIPASDWWLSVMTLTILIVVGSLLLRQYRRAATVVTLALLVTASPPATVYFSYNWHSRFDSHFSRAFDSQVFTEAHNVTGTTGRLCACIYQYYPFLGSRRQFSVCRPPELRDRAGLLRYLRCNKITHIANSSIDTQPQGLYLAVPSWLDNLSGEAHKRWDDGRYELWEWAVIDRSQVITSRQ